MIYIYEYTLHTYVYIYIFRVVYSDLWFNLNFHVQPCCKVYLGNSTTASCPQAERDNGTDKHFALAMSCGEHTSEDHYKLEVSLSQKWTCCFIFMWHTFSQIEFFEFFELICFWTFLFLGTAWPDKHRSVWLGDPTGVWLFSKNGNVWNWKTAWSSFWFAISISHVSLFNVIFCK